MVNFGELCQEFASSVSRATSFDAFTLEEVVLCATADKIQNERNAHFCRVAE